MLSKQIDVLYHKLGFDYGKCVYNAKLIIKPQNWNVLFSGIEMIFTKGKDFTVRREIARCFL